MSEKFTLETLYRIYNDNDGSYTQISEDPDGLGLIVVKHKGFPNEGLPDIEFPTMPTEKARLVARAINDLCDILEKNGK